MIGSRFNKPPRITAHASYSNGLYEKKYKRFSEISNPGRLGSVCTDNLNPRYDSGRSHPFSPIESARSPLYKILIKVIPVLEIESRDMTPNLVFFRQFRHKTPGAV